MRASSSLPFCSIVTILALAAPAATFTPLGPGAYSAMSRSGQYVLLRQSNGDITRWSSTGQVNLALNVGANDFVTGISDDGAVVIGFHTNASNIATGFRWTAAAGFTDLGDLTGGSTYSAAFAMSADGSVIAGSSASTASGTRDEAFRWTSATGLVPLGDLSGGTYTSSAAAISADGSVIVGTSNQTKGYEAFRWTQATGLIGLGDIPGGFFNSQAYDVSPDGSIVVGYSYDSLNREQAFRWTQSTGLVPLGFGSADPNEWSQARSTSADGNVIVGNNNTGTVTQIQSLIWDPAHGMRHLKTALQADYGLALPDWKLNYAWDVSASGCIIGGTDYTSSTQSLSWIIALPEPTGILPVTLTIFASRMRRAHSRILVPRSKQ